MSTSEPQCYKNNSRCVIIGCKSKGMVCHRFPNPNRYMERLLKWIDIVGLDKSDALSIYQKKVICGNHFEDSCSSPGTKRLNANAYPTLNLPGQQLLPVPANVSTSNVKINKVADLNVSGSEVHNLEQTVVTASNPNKMDSDKVFLEKYGIVEWDEYQMLNKERLSVNKKIVKGEITKCELLEHFRVELTLHKLCKHKIQVEMKKTHEVDTQVLAFLFTHVFVVFQCLHNLFSVEEDLLTYFMNFCQNNVRYLNADQLDILLAAVMRIPNNQNIWIQLLKLHLSLESLDHDKLMTTFSKGVESLEDSIPLWKLLIRNLRYRCPEIVETLLNEGTKGINGFYQEKLSLEIRPRYLEWCFEFKGLDDTRELFKELKMLEPACPKLYLVMAIIEREEPNFEIGTVRNLYKEVTRLCGTNNVGVWIDFMRFEQEYGDKKFIREICHTAIMTLQMGLFSTFMDEKDKLHQELMKSLSKAVIVIDD